MTPPPDFLPGAAVLVIGDALLDEYLIGRATRLSREAAVPVLEQTHRRRLLGGAANPARGVARLGGQATLAGVVGTDEPAGAIEALLADAGIRSVLVSDPARHTTVKTRIVAEGTLTYLQHLARIDVVDRTPLSGPSALALGAAIRGAVGSAQVLLLSHYQGGVLTPEMVATARAVAEAARIPWVVDAQADLPLFRGCDLLRCNRQEAAAALGTPLPREPEAHAEREALLRALQAQVAARAVVVTLGSDGIAWLDDTGYGEAPAANRSEVFDVTGAGDIVIAVLALALVAGWPLAAAAHLANSAAGLVVRVVGNYAPALDELYRVWQATNPAAG